MRANGTSPRPPTWFCAQRRTPPGSARANPERKSITPKTLQVSGPPTSHRVTDRGDAGKWLCCRRTSCGPRWSPPSPQAASLPYRWASLLMGKDSPWAASSALGLLRPGTGIAEQTLADVSGPAAAASWVRYLTWHGGRWAIVFHSAVALPAH